MAFDLPSALKAALNHLAEGQSRTALAQRAATISGNYRSGGNSAPIRSANDALAYALARMPATYAAIGSCLAEVARLRPEIAPTSLLDVGAGPGTATWAAAETFPSLAAFIQLDSNAALAALARALTSETARLAALQQNLGDARKSLAEAAGADLVIASYMIGELSERDRSIVTEMLWAKTSGLLVVTEPGTPAGYARIIALRAQLIAAGAHVIAPCPHDLACPLTPPDWCHFVQRLARSRDHMQVKGVALPFEDEKFSYVALARTPNTTRPAARVLAQPDVTKIEVTAKLCQADGHAAITKTPRRDKEGYAQAKRWRWGDAVD